MGSVNLESSCVLLSLESEIFELECDMESNLKQLNNAFATVCESWRDVNAQTCADALDRHCAAMYEALGGLSDCKSAINELRQLAKEYEEI